MKNINNKFNVFVMVAAVVLTACSAGPAELTGQISQETFASPVSSLVAVAADGTEQGFSVAADGKFQLALKPGKYTVTLASNGVPVPLVFGGAHGNYDAILDVVGGGGSADLGLVRHYAGAAAEPTAARNAAKSRARQDVQTEIPAGACIDGYFEGSAEPCIGADATSSCSDDDSSDDDSSDDDSSDDDSSDDDSSDDDTQAAIKGDVAIPEKGLNSLGCNDDSDSSDDSSDD